jgi:type I restriction enzyme S subunit
MARKMKDSGIEWIGEIPEGWEIKRLGAILQERNEVNNPIQTTSILSLTNNRGVIPYSEKGNQGNKAKDDLTGYKIAHIGDIVLNSMNVIIGSVGLSNYYGAVSPVYYMLFPRNNIETNIQYYNYLFQTTAFQQSLRGYGNGILEIRMRIQMQKLKTVLLPVPTFLEQSNITVYLDASLSKLNILLSKIRSSIEEYKKLKQAVITQAVTKGVRGEREMKDSGVGWIGAIPKDWEIKRLKSFCTIVDCKNRTPDVFPDGKYTVVRTTCIKDCSFSYEGSYQTDTTNFKAWTLKGQPHKGDIFFTREAPVGEACLVPNADNLCMGQRVMFFRPEDNSDARYIMYSIYGPLVREYIASKNSGSTVGHLKLGQVACIPIFYCPPLEQKEIADYLDAKCAEIAGLIAKKEQLVKELENYKKSLIYEVVTGKREV